MGLQDTRAGEAEALVWSACSAMPETARLLLGADPRLARYDLATATVCGESAIVERLVRADPARADTFFTPLGRTPLHYATFSRLGRGDPERQAALRATVRVLLDQGANPNIWFTHDGWVQAPIYGAAGIAGDVEMTRMLLDAGADPNDVGPDQSIGEALYHAAEQPDPACAAMLIEAGTGAATVRRSLSRALDFARPEMVAAFTAAGAPAGERHLHKAVWNRRGAAVVQQLVDAGAPVDAPDETGLTALQIARRWGDADTVTVLARAGAGSAADPEIGAGTEERLSDDMLIGAVRRGDLDDVRRRLDAGAGLDGNPSRESSPLGEACWRGRVAIVEELLARGAAIEFPDGGSALGTCRHGASHCHDPEGGPTMATVEEIDRTPYEQIEVLLRKAGTEPEENRSDSSSTASSPPS